MQTAKIANNHYVLLSASEIVSAAENNPKWMRHQESVQRDNGAISTATFLQRASTGDNSLVAQSDAFLSEIEGKVPMSRGWRNVDDVVGAIPNVPAFLAGHPQHMRRRVRTMLETAPLTVYMDLSSSMGIKPDMILRRGVTLLALVRMLVEHRPVELWVGSSLGNGGVTATTAWRIDTTPLDLARAAFHISDTSMSRLFGYAMCEQQVNMHLGSFGDTKIDNLKQIAGWHDVLHIPPINYYDPMVKDPIGWLNRVMADQVRLKEEA